jgi:hypothetical protein
VWEGQAGGRWVAQPHGGSQAQKIGFKVQSASPVLACCLEEEHMSATSWALQLVVVLLVVHAVQCTIMPALCA